MSAVALVVAAGRGERLGSQGPKALVRLADRTLLEWSLDAIRATRAITQIVVAMPARHAAPEGTITATGGVTRSHSVRNALALCDPAAEYVLVHDAARPLLTPELVQSVLAACVGVDAAIAAAPVTDTIKEGGDLVRRTLARGDLWAVQTPQVFRREALQQALNVTDEQLAAATDDASLIEAQGGTVRLVPAPRENLKVTTPLDLRVAELLLAQRASPPTD
jgi:2-C-methyl-D-erythritol 4-phosphate cytidylyltransferase